MSSPPQGPADEITAPDKKPTPGKRWRRLLTRRLFLVGVIIVAVSGTVVAIVDATDYYFTSENFCATSCHVMENTVYKELQKSKHWTTPTGVRPKCADCHVSGRLTFAMWDHFIGTSELLVWATNDFSNPEAFEVLRPAAADRVRMEMLSNNSKNCRRCHVMEAIQPKRLRGQTQHKAALKEGTTCISCHYNLVHKKVDPSEAFLKAIE